VGVATANANAVPVVIDSAGQLGTVSSSRRFKEEIKPMDNSSEAILGLKPVTFHYKSDKQNMPQFGLIAEEVAKVNPDLVVRDENGQIYTVRYDAVNAMLLNEFLKEHRNVAEQQTTTSQRKAVNPTIKPYTSLVCSSATRKVTQAASIQPTAIPPRICSGKSSRVPKKRRRSQIPMRAAARRCRLANISRNPLSRPPKMKLRLGNKELSLWM
jgi:hypothetical protein